MICVLPAKRSKWTAPTLVGAIFSFYVWAIVAATTVTVPTPDQPLVFYSNQCRHDLKALFLHAIKNAKTSIHLSIYGLTDPSIIAALSKKANEGLEVSIYYDRKASSSLKRLPSSIQLYPHTSSGLMHRKILVIDRSTLYLGSANFTPPSLSQHDNLVIGLLDPQLAGFLAQPTGYFFSFSRGELWLLPHEGALMRLLSLIDGAKKSIHIAMFTFTHPRVTDALAAANKRGVKVRCVVDGTTGKGASKKALEKLCAEKIPCHLSQGMQLLHHKWALIDKETLVVGSANWTAAAFTKNQDCFLVLPLGERERKFMKNLWKVIKLESLNTMDISCD